MTARTAPFERRGPAPRQRNGAASERPAPTRPPRHAANGTAQPLLAVTDLHVKVADREILRGVTLRIGPGEVHALMGPNGSGKTTLAHTLAGLPRYHVTAGGARLLDEDLLAMESDERARAGLFVAYQYPVSIPGVRILDFLRLAVQCRLGEAASREFEDRLRQNLELLKIDRGLLRRSLNEGFSGGERKRVEILQLAMLEPEMVVLDETDSGLDVDALRIVGEGVATQKRLRPAMGVLAITHYARLLEYLQPQVVHVMAGGRVRRSGTMALAHEIEASGYGWILEEAGLTEEVAEPGEEQPEPVDPPDPFRS